MINKLIYILVIATALFQFACKKNDSSGPPMITSVRSVDTTLRGSQGNAGLLQLNSVPWVANTSMSIANYSMKFEVYAAKTWSAGEIWISVGGWYGWKSYTARFAPWQTDPSGKFQPGGWVIATIPLSQFITKNEFYQTSWNPAGVTANKFSDYPATDVGFLIVNDQPKAVPANSINLAIDNVRIVKGQ